MRPTLASPCRLGFLALLLAACQPATAIPPAPTSLTYGLTLAPSGIDPHLNASSELGIPLSSVYDTLVFQDPATHTFVPGLAETWEISTDGRAYTFHLRADVKFHDGADFNAAAVCANFERITNPDNKSQKAAGMLGPANNLAACATPDPRTVTLTLQQPFAPLLDALSQVYFGMASPAAFEKWGPADYQFHQVGTGPFKFGEYVPNDHLTLARNPAYAWGPSLYTQRGPAQLETVIFKFYTDPATRAVALESGAVQIIGEVLPQDVTRLKDDARFQLHAVSIPGQPLQLLLNTQRFPTADANVRRALLLGVDRAGIVAAVFGGYSPVATGPLNAATFGYSAAAALPGYDPTQAGQLLAEAGWQDSDNDGWLEKDDQELTVDLVYQAFGLMDQVAQVVEANWKTLGVRANVQPVANFGALRGALTEGNYNALALNFSGADPDLLRAWFTSAGFYNASRVNDPELDQAFTLGFSTVDPTARAAIYADIQSRINAQTLVLPLRDYVNLNMASAKVTGLRFDAQGWWPYLIDVQLTP